MYKVYDKIYELYDYDTPSQTNSEFKWQIIKPFFESINTVVDLGCGRGYYLNKLIQCNKSCIGVEFSRVCCDKYLLFFPHVCDSIVSFCNESKKKYDVALCMDVLEHIPEESIYETLESISKISDLAIFGIANHSDVFNETELHLIRQNFSWWNTLISKFYSIRIEIYNSDKFFIFNCKNKQA